MGSGPVNDPQTKWRLRLARLIVVIAIALGTICTIEALGWLNKTTPGFTISKTGYVSSLMHTRWTGYQAGIRLNDKIIAYDDIPFTTQRELVAYLNSASFNGGLAVYRLQRAGEPLSVAVPAMFLGWDFFLVTFFTDLLVGLIYIGIGAVVFFLNPRLYGNFVLLLSGFATGIMQVLAIDYYLDQILLLPLWMTFCLFAFTATYVNIDLFKRHSLLKIKTRTFNYLTIGTLTVSIPFYFLTQNIEAYRPIPLAAMASYAVAILAIHVNCLAIYLTADSALTKKIMRFFFVIFLLVIPSYAYYLMREVFDVLLPREFVMAQVLYAVFLALTIIRFHAVDFNIRLSRSVLYGLIALFFAGTFSMVFFIVPAVGRIYGWDPTAMRMIVLGGLLALALFLLYASYAQLFDRLLFHSTYKFKGIMESVTGHLLAKLSPEEILGELKILLKQELHCPDAHFYLSAEDGGDFVIKEVSGEAAATGLPPRINPYKFSQACEDFVILSDTDVDDHAYVRELLTNTDLALFLKITFRDKTIGLAFLGLKNDNTPFIPEDISNIRTILKATATALVNARQHNAVLRLKEGLKLENQWLKTEVLGRPGELVIGERGDLADIFRNIGRIRDSDATVLLRGESGVGKEVLARTIHERSCRGDKTFIAINCAAIPEHLLESELFGHEKGAFTDAQAQKIGLFEAAHEGTIFLDEIAEISPNMQVKLLRVLQEKEIKRVGGNTGVRVDVRVIAATNRDLEDALRNKRLRPDLYFRLNVFPITIPPLRERLRDLEEFIPFFICKFAAKMNRHCLPPPREEWTRLMNYSWPGNIRELQNVIERSVALCLDGMPLTIAGLETEGENLRFEHLNQILKLDNYHQQMAAFQKLVVQRAIKTAAGNKTHAAHKLGIHSTHLYKILKQIDVH